MSDLEVVDFYDGPLAYTAESVDRVIAGLRAQLAEQAQTIESLHADVQRYADAASEQCLRAERAEAEIARLRPLTEACIRGPRSPIEPT